MTDEEHKRLNDWRAARIREIRHQAAALGRPAEYEYLKRYARLHSEFRRDFPGVSTLILDMLGDTCCLELDPLNLDEINRIRMEFDEPPLDFVPEVVGRMDYRVPAPKLRPDAEAQESKFYEWARDQVCTAYHVAAATGKSPDEALLSCPWILVGKIVRHFPALNPAWCLFQLRFRVAIDRPATLDPLRVAGIKSWHGTVNDVAEEVQKFAAQKDKLPPMPLKQ